MRCGLAGPCAEASRGAAIAPAPTATAVAAPATKRRRSSAAAGLPSAAQQRQPPEKLPNAVGANMDRLSLQSDRMDASLALVERAEQGDIMPASRAVARII